MKRRDYDIDLCVSAKKKDAFDNYSYFFKKKTGTGTCAIYSAAPDVSEYDVSRIFDLLEHEDNLSDIVVVKSSSQSTDAEVVVDEILSLNQGRLRQRIRRSRSRTLVRLRLRMRGFGIII